MDEQQRPVPLLLTKPDQLWIGAVKKPGTDDEYPLIMLGWKAPLGDLMRELLGEIIGRGQLPQICILTTEDQGEIGYFLRLVPGNEVWIRKLFDDRIRIKLGPEVSSVAVASTDICPLSAISDFMRVYKEKKFFILTLLTLDTDRHRDIYLNSFSTDLPEFLDKARTPS
jgi:hypothetical protein